MKLNALAAAVLAIAIAAPVAPAPIELNLKFGNVTATFFGLDDAIAGSQAVKSYDFVGELGTYRGIIAPDPGESNSFKLTNGELDSVSFTQAPFFEGFPSGTVLLSFACSAGSSSNATCGAFEIGGDGPGAISEGTVLAEVRQVLPLPLPTGGLLLLAGLSFAVAVKRSKKVAS